MLCKSIALKEHLANKRAIEYVSIVLWNIGTLLISFVLGIMFFLICRIGWYFKGGLNYTGDSEDIKEAVTSFNSANINAIYSLSLRVFILLFGFSAISSLIRLLIDFLTDNVAIPCILNKDVYVSEYINTEKEEGRYNALFSVILIIIAIALLVIVPVFFKSTIDSISYESAGPFFYRTSLFFVSLICLLKFFIKTKIGLELRLANGKKSKINYLKRILSIRIIITGGTILFFLSLLHSLPPYARYVFIDPINTANENIYALREKFPEEMVSYLSTGSHVKYYDTGFYFGSKTFHFVSLLDDIKLQTEKYVYLISPFVGKLTIILFLLMLSFELVLPIAYLFFKRPVISLVLLIVLTACSSIFIDFIILISSPNLFSSREKWLMAIIGGFILMFILEFYIGRYLKK